MNVYLMLGGSLSVIAALLHLVCIYIGAPGYRIMGAGERMASLAEEGDMQPTIITFAITLILSIWALYAFKGAAAGVNGAGINLVQLPLLKLGLVAITAVYLTRGLIGFYFIFKPQGNSPRFWFYSSAICTMIGLLHLLGLYQQWFSMTW